MARLNGNDPDRDRDDIHRLKAGADKDQARVVTPTDAIRSGASHLVVGRPITGAADPAAVARAITAEIAAAA